ncbi:hypothetical protein FPV67DRAFT_1477315 [Lyophyllum atratum]|nr:hypothetical protein FPV67DRAFT_1477315 [Lyophyllum atratum]
MAHASTTAAAAVSADPVAAPAPKPSTSPTPRPTQSSHMSSENLGHASPPSSWSITSPDPSGASQWSALPPPPPGLVAQQPRGSRRMEVGGMPGEVPSPSSPPGEQGREGQDQGERGVRGVAKRLRGGCIPCPDGSRCWIIPIPCCC